ncbi:heparanase-like [Plodia interpunctella]|uniref:heparanase-like n=1 Tax=Plodia interpunctella TaxID=58824 RepID=UPI0023678939|nr:heparanase-like [Plodia interpunctella]
MGPWYLLALIPWVSADTFKVKIGTDQHVNSVDPRFLSFTVDPKYLFSSTDKFNSNECFCMASSLTPAYLRIAGPSTSRLIFFNNSISIADNDIKTGKKRHVIEKLSVSHSQWKQFAKWAKTTGFDLVFALNNREQTRNHMWDPNAALRLMTLAEKVNIGKMFWQLGYECADQSIEEYLNDLQTLRVIVETFAPGQTLDWKVVGGDVTNCLQADSKSDFKDYVSLSLEMMDAVLLNGNSSSRQLERMSEHDRLKLLKLLSASATPLWITERPRSDYNELERAADWMASLGYSARNGFAVHYTEMRENELSEPTLSFYMALLFKNLVGERVLNVDMESDKAALFAHCTSLRRKVVPGAVTLYGVNMDDEPARFSVKLSKREEGGDIMQFILGYDESGEIIVNGHVMSREGDIKPSIKRVRPYKTLLINLPPKSFGFWVLANTKVDACYDYKENSNETNLVEAVEVTYDEGKRISKRSIIEDFDYANIADQSDDFSDLDGHENCDEVKNPALKKTIDNLNENLKKIFNIFGNKANFHDDIQELPSHPRNLRKKRHIDESSLARIKKHLFKPRQERKRILDLDLSKNGLLGNLLQLKGKRSNIKNVKNEKIKFKTSKNKVNTNNFECPAEKRTDNLDNIKVNEEKVSRKRRGVVFTEKQNLLKKQMKDSENEIEEETIDSPKIWKMLNKIQKQLDKMEMDVEDKNDIEYLDDKSKDGQILVKTKLLNDGAMINLSEHPDHGLIKSTFQNVFSVLGELNTNLNRVWNALTLLE